MSNWAHGAVAGWRCGLDGLTPEASWPVRGRGARQSELLGSFSRDETPRVKDCFV